MAAIAADGRYGELRQLPAVELATSAADTWNSALTRRSKP